MERFGTFSLWQLLASGGMGEVFIARREETAGPWVALKRAHASLAQHPFVVRRFLDERRLAGRFVHANIARVLEGGSVDGRIWSASELVNGVNLARLRQEDGGPLPIAEAVLVVLEAARSLHALHNLDDRGSPLEIVHGDVAAGNLMIEESGRVVLVDVAAAPRLVGPTDSFRQVRLRLLSPEEAQHRRADRRADIYQLGLLLRELVTAERLFSGLTPAQTLDAILEHGVPRLPQPAPHGLDAIVAKATARDASERYATAAVLAAELAELLSGELKGREEEARAALGARVARSRSALPATLIASLGGRFSASRGDGGASRS